ncbi:MAG: tRNA pseudouridine(13) synthase TruD [Planctomycetota bacterium]
MPRSSAAARIPGRYKTDCADFVVDEVPAYEPSGEGEHLFLRIEKTGLSTLDAVALLGRALGRRDREFGIAGLKDARAVARQWISIDGVDPERAVALSAPGLRVLEVHRHGNKLKMGHLRGNRFSILVEGAGPEHAEAAQAILDDLTARGVPNYFGEQRFGKRGANLDKGLRILCGNPRKAARTMPRRLLGLVVSAVQSEVFNGVVRRRLGSLDTMFQGDVAWLHRNGACFVVADAAREAPRCARLEISPSGPLPGPKILRPEGEPGAIEAEVQAELGIDPAWFGRMPRGTHDGARRPLRAPVGEARLQVEPRGLRLEFELPRGSYATSVLREVLRDSPWFG